jgi:recombinational DNA repair ATPase RecF
MSPELEEELDELELLDEELELELEDELLEEELLEEELDEELELLDDELSLGSSVVGPHAVKVTATTLVQISFANGV